jgi:hypothetical protein
VEEIHRMVSLFRETCGSAPTCFRDVRSGDRRLRLRHDSSLVADSVRLVNADQVIEDADALDRLVGQGDVETPSA